MDDKAFNALVDAIQTEALDEAKQAFGESGYHRWRNPKFCGKLNNPDSSARLKGSCGDTMEMYIKVDSNSHRVSSVSYLTDGCGSSSVAGSFAAELATGKSFQEVQQLTGKDVINAIGKFPREEEHCAYLAIKTIQKAVSGYIENKD